MMAEMKPVKTGCGLCRNCRPLCPNVKESTVNSLTLSQAHHGSQVRRSTFREILTRELLKYKIPQWSHGPT